MPEARNVQLGVSTNREGKNPAKAGLGWPLSRWVDDSRCAAPSGHQCHILNSADEVGNWRSHDSRSGVELPKFLAVGGTVGAKNSV